MRSRSSLVVGALCAGLFCVLALLAIGFRFPTVNDEIGYLSIANYLAGGGGFSMAENPFYHAGQGILIAPLFAILGDTGTVYQAAVLLSCLATALIPAVLVGLAKELEIPLDARLLAASVLVAVFPSFFYHNFLVWPETTLRLGVLVWLYVFARSVRTGSVVTWVLFAAIACLLYALHPRALPFIPLSLGLAFLGACCARISWLTFALCAVAAASIFLGIGAVHDQFRILWEGTRSQGDQIGRLVASIQNVVGVKRLIVTATGQLWYLIASSFGLFLVGLWAAFHIVGERKSLKSFAIWAAAILAFIGVFAASALQMVGFSRVDHVIYGRYLDAVSTPFIWLGLLYLPMLWKQSRVGLLFAPVLAIVVLGAIPSKAVYDENLASAVEPNISGLLWVKYIGSPITSLPVPTIVLFGSALGILVFVVAGLLARTSAWRGMAVVAVAVLFADVAVYGQNQNNRDGREDYVARSAELLSAAGGKPVYWDRSAWPLIGALVDQYSALQQRIPTVDLRNEQLPDGSFAVFGVEGPLPAGYGCAGRFLDGTRLIGPSSVLPSTFC